MGLLTRALALAIVLLGLIVAPASAATTYTVDNTGDGFDTSPGDNFCSISMMTPGQCTLRAAIQEANATAGADTIVLPAGNYNLTIPFSGSAEPNGSEGDLDINSTLTIQGAGARTTLIQQHALDRVFEIRAAASGATIKGVTISGGQPNSLGGGILNTGTQTLIQDVAVRDNVVGTSTPGAGIANNGSITVDRTLITNNQTPSATGGGGIYNSSGNVTVLNSTLSGNQAETGSGLLDGATSGSTTIQYSTITANRTTGASGAALARFAGGATSPIRDSIVALNGGGAGNCGGSSFKSDGHNIESGTSCGFTNAAGGDKQSTDPKLAALAYSSASDQTETHALQLGSPAIDGGNSVGCPAVDQRGQPRPVGATCDVGAFEAPAAPPPPPPAPKPAQLLLDPPTANRKPGDANSVTATVRNDDGTAAANQSVRYSISGANPNAGAVTTDSAGTARISWDGVHEGTDTLSAFVDTNANFASDTGEPTGQATVTWALPEPTQGKTANIEPVSGRVRITVKGGAGKVGAAGNVSQVLTEARQVPLSTVVDVRRGRVRMTTEANKAGDVQKGEFYGGVYTTTQSSTSSRPITELRMTESLICQSSSTRGKLTAARARSRHLWGNGKGRYRTRGRYSTATVRGTIWVQKDSCNTTTTSVKQGVVIVKDLVKRKNVRVKAGKHYTARKKSRSSR